MFNKLSTEKKSVNIMKQILREIEEGHIKDKLPTEQQLSQSLGVSRSVIREAMSSLVTMGIVDRIAGKGTFITSEHKKDKLANSQSVIWNIFKEIDKSKGLYDAFIARVIIEPTIIEYTASKISKKQIDYLYKLYDNMKKAIESENLNQYQEEDIKFHLKLIEYSNNKVLYDLYKIIIIQEGYIKWDATKLWPKDLKSGNRSLTEHKKLIQALSQNETITAKNIMREHLIASISECKKEVNYEEN